jgi:hypothetical protein
MPFAAFTNEVGSLSSYYDYSGLVTKVNSQFSRFNNVLVVLFLPECLTISDAALQINSLECIFYLPKVTNLGSTVLNNSVFSGNTHRQKIYTNPFLQNVNSGSSDGDITSIITNGGSVSYVQNLTKPNPITIGSFGIIYSTAIQLINNGTSQNTIDYYENVVINGVEIGTVKAGEYIVGLTPQTSYEIKAVSVDVFFNKSILSNLVTVLTNSVSAVPLSGLASSYKFNETSGLIAVDSFSGVNLTNSGITINQSGKIDKAYLSTAGNQSLSATGVTPILGNFSINIWCFRTGNGTGSNNNIIEHGDFSAGFGIWVNSSNFVGYFINSDFQNYTSLIVLPLNTWVMCTVVYNGSNVIMYQNGQQKTTKTTNLNPNTASTRRLFNRIGNNEGYIGRVDEALIYNRALNQSEINLIYNNGNGITL